jgi:hypothetical protein
VSWSAGHEREEDRIVASQEKSVGAGINVTLAAGGFAFILMALVSFIALGYLTVSSGGIRIEKVSAPAVLAFYGNHVIIFATAIVTAALGVRLLRASGSAYLRVIPPEDYAVLEQAIKQGKPESIDQYVRLSSLSGFTGGFTKIGLTGLPLTTVSLTIVFSLLAMYDKESYLDLAKLTLGAFIGSFVQKQVEGKAPQPSTRSQGPAQAPSSSRPSLPA